MASSLKLPRWSVLAHQQPNNGAKPDRGHRAIDTDWVALRAVFVQGIPAFVTFPRSLFCNTITVSRNTYTCIQLHCLLKWPEILLLTRARMFTLAFYISYFFLVCLTHSSYCIINFLQKPRLSFSRRILRTGVQYSVPSSGNMVSAESLYITVQHGSLLKINVYEWY